MTVDYTKKPKSDGTWTVGWNRPGWSSPTTRNIEYPNFQLAYEGFVAILRGEGSRQQLDDYQRVMLNQLIGYLDGRVRREIDNVEDNGGQAEVVGGLIFWLALIK